MGNSSSDEEKGKNKKIQQPYFNSQQQAQSQQGQQPKLYTKSQFMSIVNQNKKHRGYRVTVCQSEMQIKDIKLVQDQNLLTFQLNVNAPVNIFVFFNATEVTNEIQQKTSKILSKLSPFTQQIEQSQFMQIQAPKFEELVNYEENIYSVLINMSTSKVRIYSYYNIQLGQNNDFEIILLKQKLEHQNEIYQINKIFTQNENNEANQDEKELCLVCFSNQADCITMPCRHMFLCYECCESLKAAKQKTAKDCPICRVPIKNFIWIKQKN